MKLGFQLVLYIVILNLACTLVYVCDVPGTEEMTVSYSEGNLTDTYQQQFNATEFLNKTDPYGAEQLSLYFGYVVGALGKLWSMIGPVIAGFPFLLRQIGDSFTLSGDAKTTYDVICGMIVAIQTFIVLGWLFQVATGRSVQD